MSRGTKNAAANQVCKHRPERDSDYEQQDFESPTTTCERDRKSKLSRHEDDEDETCVNRENYTNSGCESDDDERFAEIESVYDDAASTVDEKSNVKPKVCHKKKENLSKEDLAKKIIEPLIQLYNLESTRQNEDASREETEPSRQRLPKSREAHKKHSNYSADSNRRAPASSRLLNQDHDYSMPYYDRSYQKNIPKNHQYVNDDYPYNKQDRIPYDRYEYQNNSSDVDTRNWTTPNRYNNNELRYRGEILESQNPLIRYPPDLRHHFEGVVPPPPTYQPHNNVVQYPSDTNYNTHCRFVNYGQPGVSFPPACSHGGVYQNVCRHNQSLPAVCGHFNCVPRNQGNLPFYNSYPNPAPTMMYSNQSIVPTLIPVAIPTQRVIQNQPSNNFAAMYSAPVSYQQNSQNESTILIPENRYLSIAPNNNVKIYPFSDNQSIGALQQTQNFVVQTNDNKDPTTIYPQPSAPPHYPDSKTYKNAVACRKTRSLKTLIFKGIKCILIAGAVAILVIAIVRHVPPRKIQHS